MNKYNLVFQAHLTPNLAQEVSSVNSRHFQNQQETALQDTSVAPDPALPPH